MNAHKAKEEEHTTKRVIAGFDFSEQDSHRSCQMKTYFKSELSALTMKVIERSIHDFTR